MKISKNSLQARIKNISLSKKIPANVVLQHYFFDAFLKRLSKSKYVKNFIFKGGFLLSSILGIDFRSTMDIDFLVKNILLEKEKISEIMREIIGIDVGDGIVFEFKSISEIRNENIYGGYNISFVGRFENIKVPVNIDLAAGDAIVGGPAFYRYKCILDEEYLDFISYDFETILSEKIQTVLFRGTLNSRCKDFYDIYIIRKLRIDEIDFDKLAAAFFSTCNCRKTIFEKELIL